MRIQIEHSSAQKTNYGFILLCAHLCVLHTIHSPSIRNRFEWRTFQRFVFIFTWKRRTVWHNADANDEHIKATFFFIHAYARTSDEIKYSRSLYKKRYTHTYVHEMIGKRSFLCVYKHLSAVPSLMNMFFICICIFCSSLALSLSRWGSHIIFFFHFHMCCRLLAWNEAIEDNSNKKMYGGPTCVNVLVI